MADTGMRLIKQACRVGAEFPYLLYCLVDKHMHVSWYSALKRLLAQPGICFSKLATWAARQPSPLTYGCITKKRRPHVDMVTCPLLFAEL